MLKVTMYISIFGQQLVSMLEKGLKFYQILRKRFKFLSEIGTYVRKFQ